MDPIFLLLLFLIMFGLFTIAFLMFNILLTNKINSVYSEPESTSIEQTESESQLLLSESDEIAEIESSEDRLLSINTESEDCTKSKEIRKEIRKNHQLDEDGQRLDGKELMNYSDEDDVYGKCVQPYVHEACTQYARCTNSPYLDSGCYIQSNDGLVVGCPAKCCNSEPLSEESSSETEVDVDGEEATAAAAAEPVAGAAEPADGPAETALEGDDPELEGFSNYKWFSKNY